MTTAQRCAVGGVVVGTAVLAFYAARADSRVPDAAVSMTVLDVAVGLAFVAAALITPAAIPERGLAAAVGATWLVGSFVNGTELVHQGVLIVMLVAFPRGKPRDYIGWVFVALAVVVSLKFFSQIGVALVFAAVAATALVGVRPGRAVVVYRSLAASGVAAALGLSWMASRGTFSGYDPRLALATYEIVLIVVALTFTFAVNKVLRGADRLADQLVGDTRLVGIDGLAIVLRDALADPGLRIYTWSGSRAQYIDGEGGSAPHEDEPGRHTYVADLSGPLALLVHRSGLLDDPPTAEAVGSAVRLAVENVRLREELDAQVAELGAARARLLAATDRQRSITAVRLRDDVVAPLDRATENLVSWQAVSMPTGDTADAMVIAIDEVAAATDEVMALVAGVPPTALGGGRLRDALAMVTLRSPVPVTLTGSPDVRADAAVETDLFYVCSEAIANATKHAGATGIVVDIVTDAGGITVSVSDDGRGGADVAGSGLQGLADRLASRGGRLRVESPPGAGTVVTAMVPNQPILVSGSSNQFQTMK